MLKHKFQYLLTFILTIVIITSNTTPAEDIRPVSDPNRIDVTLMQGQSTVRQVTLKNQGNETLSGELRAINVDCGTECPTIGILNDKSISIPPNSEIKIDIKIKSNIMNKVDTISLSIKFVQNESYWPGFNILTIRIKIIPNYFIIGGIVVIIAIPIILVIYRSRKRKITSDQDKIMEEPNDAKSPLNKS